MTATVEENGLVVLNVNDDDAARYVLGRHLRAGGFRVLEAATGGEALALAKRERPDAIVLDVKLPDISGYLVAQRLREEPSTATIPIVHASAMYTTPDKRVEGLERGADAYLAQPVDGDELVATVRALLRNRRAEREARRAYEQWQATFDAMGNALCLVDASGAVAQCNRAMALLLGREVTRIVGRAYADVAAALLGPLDGLAAPAGEGEGGGALARELCVGDRWFRVTADAMLGDGGEQVATVLVLSDVTLQKRVEGHRERLFREAEAASRLKDEFLATLSHELRTPMNAVLGWLHLVQSGELDEGAREKALETVARNARQQARLIDDVLDVSRIVSGKQTLHVKEFAWHELVDAAVESLAPRAREKRVEVRVAGGDGAGRVTGDPERLQQAVCNLLANAIKFTPAGGRVEVRTRLEGENVVFTVRDTGQGIAPGFLPHVFDRFRQADSSMVRSHGGLGLGLSLVRYFVELHGGAVHAESPGEGLGATFSVALPRATTYGAASAFAPRRPALRLGAVPAKGGDLRGVRVLVVDDEDDARALVAKVLELHGASVDVADCVPAALERVEAAAPDVLVSDIGMPVEDGFALVRTLRERGYDATRLAAIALTAFARAADNQRALEAGFDLHLAKPIEPDALASAVVSVSQGRRGAAS